MKVRTMWLAVALLLTVVGFLPSTAHAQKARGEKKIEVPAAVLKAFQKAYPKGEIKNVGVESKDGVKYYEVESIDGTTRRDILYKDDGTVFEIEEGIPVDHLPGVVTKAIASEYPNGTLKKAEMITRGDTTQFEILLENKEENLEILLDSSGKVLSQKAAADDDEESDSDEPDGD